MKTMLVLGNAKSVFMKDYVKFILFDSGYKIFLTEQHKLNKESKNFIRKIMYLLPLYKFDSQKLSSLKKQIYIIKFIQKVIGGKIDFLNIQNVPFGNFVYFIAFLQKFYSKKSGIAFWGSDILRLSHKNSKKLKYALNLCDTISLSTKEMRNKFELHYNNKYADKIIDSCYFGSPIISYIKEANIDKKLAKKYFDLPTEKKIIHIGYNGSTTQQHIKVIEQLSKLDLRYKKQIFIQLHVGYGLENKKYLHAIKIALANSGIEFKLLNIFFDKKETSLFRLSADIFIHAQITDAMSSSIREYLFSDVIVINPEWIKYHELRNLGVEYIEYSSFTDLRYNN